MIRTLNPRAAPQSEHQLHVAVRCYLSIAIAHPGRLSRDNVVWYSVGHEAPMSAVSGGLRKLRGIIAGLPDVDIYHDEAAFKIELKTTKGGLSDAQKELHPVLRKTGVNVAVCRSVADVAAQLERWRIPINPVRLT